MLLLLLLLLLMLLLLLIFVCIVAMIGCILFHAATVPPVGQRLLTIEALRSHSDTPQSAGLLWTSVQPYAENST